MAAPVCGSTGVWQHRCVAAPMCGSTYAREACIHDYFPHRITSREESNSIPGGCKNGKPCEVAAHGAVEIYLETLCTAEFLQ